MTTKILSLDTIKRLLPGFDVVEAGSFFCCTSQNATKGGVHDYIATIIPRELPIDKDEHAIVPGECADEQFLELDLALGGFRTVVRTGKFTPGTDKQPAPTFELQHPAVARDIIVHVIWDEEDGAPLRDHGGLDGAFGRRYQARWYHRYPSVTKPSEHRGEDVWILPANGPAKPIADYCAAKVDRLIREGDIAAEARREAEREYQAHKAEYRKQFEESGLIERFKELYGRYGEITMTLGDDEVIIACPTGSDKYPYDDQLISAIRFSIERASRADAIIRTGAPLEETLVRLMREGLI